jgi:hypothetical protein
MQERKQLSTVEIGKANLGESNDCYKTVLPRDGGVCVVLYGVSADRVRLRAAVAECDYVSVVAEYPYVSVVAECDDVGGSAPQPRLRGRRDAGVP